MARSKKSISRRNWLGLFSSASLGSGLVSAQAATGPQAQSAAPRRTRYLGVRTYDIRDFGAKGDGQALDTAAVQAAIDACHNDNGGTVVIPSGTFLIGSVELKSNVTLYISAEGKLLGSTNGRDYHGADHNSLKGSATLPDGNVALIFAVNAEDVTIEGPGIIDGQGVNFPSMRRHISPPALPGGEDRPHSLLFYRCKNVQIRDVFLFASAFHAVRVLQSRFVWCDRVRIYNRVNRNNDGFHFVSCENVHVSNCDVQCQDDACAMFGSCRKITVTNSSFSTRWSVFRLGGGDPSDITISNCVIYETYGCPIKMTFGPESRAENILFSNIVMDDVTGPISIGLGKKTVTAGFDRADVTGPVSKSLAEDSRQEAAPNKPSRRGYVRNITFNGLRARVIANGRQFPDIPFVQDYRSGETRQCIALNCITDSFIEGITFQDVHVTYAGGGTLQEANRTIPAVVGEYYERGTPPAYGLYARRVRGLTLNNVRFETELPDLRPAVVFDHVADAALTGLSAQGNKKAMALLRFFYASDVLVTAARVLSPAAVFLRVEGYSSRNIVVDGGDLSKAATVSELKGGAKIDTVKLRA